MKTNIVTPQVKSLDQYMVNKINGELLKFAAGNHMFCKGCDQVLDWKTTVIIEAEKDSKTVTVVSCNKCFNPKGLKALEEKGFTIEITKYSKT